VGNRRLGLASNKIEADRIDVESDLTITDNNINIAIVTVALNIVYTNAFKVFKKDMSLRKAFGVFTGTMEEIPVKYIDNLMLKLREFDVVLIEHWNEQIDSTNTLFEYMVGHYEMCSNIVLLWQKGCGIINTHDRQIHNISEIDSKQIYIEINSQYEYMIGCYNLNPVKHRLNTVLMLSLNKAYTCLEKTSSRRIIDNIELDYKASLNKLRLVTAKAGEKSDKLERLKDFRKYIGEKNVGLLLETVKSCREGATDLRCIKAYTDFYNEVYRSLSYSLGYGVKYRVYGKNGIEFPFAFTYYDEDTDTLNIKDDYYIINIELLGLHGGGANCVLNANNINKGQLNFNSYNHYEVEPSLIFDKMLDIRGKLDNVCISKDDGDKLLAKFENTIYNLYCSSIYVSRLDRHNLELVISKKVDEQSAVDTVMHIMRTNGIYKYVFRVHIIKDKIKRKWFVSYGDENTLEVI
jgi:hypothetical protein